MIAFSSLVSLSFICSAAGFTVGPVSTRSRPGHPSRFLPACQPPAQNKSPRPVAWRSIKQQQQQQQQPSRTFVARASTGDAETEANADAPRLKRVRRRRKDASSVVAEEEEEKEGVATALPSFSEQALPPAAAELESARAAAEAVSPPSPEVAPRSVAPPVEQAEEMALPEGGTKGTKVSVDNSGDDMTERLAEVASAASGAAGGAASAVSDAAKSAMWAAMSAVGQGGAQSTGDDFDINNVPKSSSAGRRRTTPGKSVAELADLGADIERFRQQEDRQPAGAGESLAAGAKDVISTIITVDFFVVIAFMLWFIAGVVSSYGFSNTFLLDQFNEKWTPLVQPALGVLMGGTIAGGVISKVGEFGDDKDKKD